MVRPAHAVTWALRFLVFNIVPTLLEIGVVAVLLAWQYGIAFGAITLLSDPDEEAEETLVKARPFLTATRSTLAGWES